MNLKIKYILMIITVLGVVILSSLMIGVALKDANYQNALKSCLRTEGTDLEFCKDFASKIAK